MTDTERLLAEIADRRGDEEFMSRLRAQVAGDKPLLDRLAGDQANLETTGHVCCICLFVEPDEPIEDGSLTVINGQMVHADCAGYVIGGEFSQSLLQARREREDK